jgi:radical SAM family uncharacterized protein/radical SAM-linked protein
MPSGTFRPPEPAGPSGLSGLSASCPAASLPLDIELLKSVQRPGRYLGGETGARPNEVPDARGRIFRVALAFPDVYEIAHSHLGHKILYSLVNSVPGLSAERSYAPWTDMEAAMRARGLPLASLESRRPLRLFDLVGFSLQYELGYTNILNMLDLAGIPLLSSDRAEGDPLVAAGGPGCANPEPLADFIDVFFLGDGEPNLAADLEAISGMRAEGMPRGRILLELARRPGVYVPSLYAPVYAGPGLSSAFLRLEPLVPGLPELRRTAAPALSGLFFPGSQIVPHVKPVHDRVAVEIARGCSRGCRFCQAGYLYRPVRERAEGEALSLVEANLAATGQDEAAFLSLSAGDHTRIGPLVKGFMDRWSGRGVSLSLPSLRVRSITRELALEIQRARKTGFTIAPEAATARLRAVVNKDLAEDDILAAAETAFSLGWRTLKLYFMCGLPTETPEDLAAIGRLAKRIKRSTRAKLNVGLAHFTPKAHTPFQWERGTLAEGIRERIALVKSAARLDGISVKHADAGASFAESLIARGDRRTGRVILEVFRSGARFEAWNDLFSLKPWEEALAAGGFDANAFLGPRDTDAPLPWDHIFYGVSKPYLVGELRRAYAGEPTPDCRDSGCLGCGACGDGVRIDLAGNLSVPTAAPGDPTAPETAARAAAPGPPPATGADPATIPCAWSPDAGSGTGTAPDAGSQAATDAGSQAPPDAGARAASLPEAVPGTGLLPPAPPGRPAARQSKASGRTGPPSPAAPHQFPPEYRYLARFEKTGRPVFLGHLEQVELFKRAFRRGGLSLALSHGFHPSPKLSFMTALPLGVPSLDEVMIFSLSDGVPPEEILASLDLPEGLRLTRLARLPLARPRPELKGSSWLVAAGSPAFADPPLYPDAHLGYTDKKGRAREYLIRDFILETRALSPARLEISLAFRETGSPKPLDCVRALWGLPPSLPLELSKLKTLIG